MQYAESASADLCDAADRIKLKSHAVAMEVFYELLHHFAKWEEEPVMTERSADMERMGEIITYIDRHHREPISLESISSEFYLSRGVFQPFFQEKYGSHIFTICQSVAADSYLS